MGLPAVWTERVGPNYISTTSFRLRGRRRQPVDGGHLSLDAPGDVALSLGTSDTFMAVSREASPRLEGHVFASCTQPGEFLALLCYANGGPSRERIKRDLLGPKASWDEFGRALKRAPPGNGGILGLELANAEITPVIRTGRFFVDQDDRVLRLGDGQADPSSIACRAVVEGGSSRCAGAARRWAWMLVKAASGGRRRREVAGDRPGSPPTCARRAGLRRGRARRGRARGGVPRGPRRVGRGRVFR